MRTRFFILHNPKAGKAARRRYQRTLTLLKDQGASLECVDTGRHGEGMRVAAEAANAERFDAVVAAGGDGTVHDVATGLLGTSIPLGIIPLGTANVFAREVALRLSPGHVVSTLMKGEIHSIPLGQINGQQSVLFVVGIGFDARAVRQFEVRGTRQFGQAGFVLPLVHALLSEGHRSLQIATERGKTEAEWVIVASGRLRCRCRWASDIRSRERRADRIAFFAHGKRTATVTALRDSIVLQLPRADFVALAEDQPAVLKPVAVTLARRFADITLAGGERPLLSCPRTIVVMGAGGAPVPDTSARSSPALSQVWPIS